MFKTNMDKISPSGDGDKFGNTTRKLKKPAIEKKRRDRINRSLSHLKALLLQNLQRNGGIQTAKLDKADVLEMTVNYITMIQDELPLVTMATNNKYNHGYPFSAREAACLRGNIQICQNQVYEKTADDNMPLCASTDTQPIQIFIPQTNELTPTSFIPMQNKSIQLDTKIKVNDQKSVNSVLDKNVGCQTTNKMKAEYISPFQTNMLYSRELENSYRNEHGECLGNEEIKVWRPW